MSAGTEDRPWSGKVVSVVREALGHFGQDNAGRMALAIAYRTLFALTPLLLISTSIAGFIFRREATLGALVGQASRFLGEAGAKLVEDALSNTAETATTTGLLGLALLLWTGSSLFIEVRQSLNDIFRVANPPGSGITRFLRMRLVGFLAVLALGIVLIAIVALNLAATTAERYFADRLPWLQGIIPWLIPVASVAILAVVMALQFQWFTVRTIPWRAAWWGGAITSVLLIIASLGLGWYIGTRDQLTAGAFTGGAIIVLFLVGALAQAYLFGAEVTRVISDRRIPAGPPPQETKAEAAPARISVVAAFLVGLVFGLRRRSPRSRDG